MKVCRRRRTTMPPKAEDGRGRRRAQLRRARAAGYASTDAHAHALVNHAFSDRSTPEGDAAEDARYFRQYPFIPRNRLNFRQTLRERGFGRWRARAQWNVMERQRRQRWMLTERRLGVPFRPRRRPDRTDPDDLQLQSQIISQFRRPPRPPPGGGMGFVHDEL